MKKLRRIVKNMRWSRKLLMSYLLACLIPLALSTAVIHRASVKNLEEESMELAALYRSQVVSNLNRFIEESDRITKLILIDNATIAAINQAGEAPVSEEINNRLEIRKLLMRIAMSQANIDSVVLMTKSGGFYQYSDSGINVNQEQMLAEGWMQKLLTGRDVLTVTPAHYTGYYESSKDQIAVTVGRKLYDYSGREIGLLLIDIDPFSLVELNETFQLTGREYHILVCVRTLTGEFLYDSDVINGEKSWQQIIEMRELEGENDSDNIVMKDTVSKGRLEVISIIPRKELLGNVSRITMIMGIAITVSIILSGILSVSLSWMLKKPITLLQERLGKVGEGVYTKIEEYSSEDEIGTLIEYYNQMLDRIQQLINDVYLQQIKQKDARLLALRAQINPHMLFNTLESIRMKALLNGDKETAQMIKLLAKMFRASLDRDEEVNTIGNELEYVRSYILLQNVRFPDRFSFESDFPKELLEVPMVPLTFQPIVENSISHGNRGSKQVLHIRITGRLQEDGSVQILFEDDGLGMSQERMEEMNRELERLDSEALQEPDKKESIGLRNIAERIYLRYGKGYYVRILESKEKKTVICLRVPGKEKEG